MATMRQVLGFECHSKYPLHVKTDCDSLTTIGKSNRTENQTLFELIAAENSTGAWFATIMKTSGGNFRNTNAKPLGYIA